MSLFVLLGQVGVKQILSYPASSVGLGLESNADRRTSVTLDRIVGQSAGLTVHDPSELLGGSAFCSGPIGAQTRCQPGLAPPTSVIARFADALKLADSAPLRIFTVGVRNGWPVAPSSKRRTSKQRA